MRSLHDAIFLLPSAMDIHGARRPSIRGRRQVVAGLPEHTSGSDLREIVRPALLAADDQGQLNTAAFLAEVGSGRYRATAPEGMYL